MGNWAQIRNIDGVLIVRMLVLGGDVPVGVDWYEITGVEPFPQVGQVYSNGVFLDPTSASLPEKYTDKAIALAKQAKPGLLNPATQAEALGGICKGIAAILLLLLKSTELPE